MPDFFFDFFRFFFFLKCFRENQPEEHSKSFLERNQKFELLATFCARAEAVVEAWRKVGEKIREGGQTRKAVPLLRRGNTTIFPTNNVVACASAAEEILSPP